jgi:hypothetical protein
MTSDAVIESYWSTALTIISYVVSKFRPEKVVGLPVELEPLVRTLFNVYVYLTGTVPRESRDHDTVMVVSVGGVFVKEIGFCAPIKLVNA